MTRYQTPGGWVNTNLNGTCTNDMGQVVDCTRGTAQPTGLGGDTGSSATGSTDTSGITNINGQPTDRSATSGGTTKNTPTDRGPAGASSGSGGTYNPSNAPAALTPDQQGSNAGIQNLPPGQWYSNLAGDMFGQMSVLNDPGTFWQTYANQKMGLGPNSATGMWLGNLIKEPWGLSAAMGKDVSSNANILSAETNLGDVLGNPATSFDPGTIVKNVLGQLASFDPNKAFNPDGTPKAGVSQIALNLYDPNPATEVDNIVNFLVGSNGVLNGILAPQLLTGFRTALALAGNAVKQKLIGPGGGPTMTDQHGGNSAYVGNTLMQMLGHMGVM